MEIVLYHYPGACSLASLVALEESGLGFRVQAVDLFGDRSEYRRTNPSGKVPALTLDGELLTENVAILYRVGTLAPQAGLIPADPVSLSRTLSLLAWFSSTVHIVRRQIRVPSRFTPDVPAQEKLVEAGRPRMWSLLEEMETRLGADEWFGGDSFSVADAYALVFYSWSMTDGFPIGELPRLTGWGARMLARTGVRTALMQDRGPLRDSLVSSVE